MAIRETLFWYDEASDEVKEIFTTEFFMATSSVFWSRDREDCLAEQALHQPIGIDEDMVDSLEVSQQDRYGQNEDYLIECERNEP